MQVLRFPSWRIGASGLAIEGLEKEEDGPKWRLVCGNRIFIISPIVIQTLLKGAQTPSLMPIQGDMESQRLHVLTPFRKSREIHLPSNFTDLIPHVGCAAEK